MKSWIQTISFPSISVPPDLCLLGCIFFICDYQDDSEQKQYCDDWKKVIRQFGGEVEDSYHPAVTRITHVLCKSQDSAICQQALRDQKRVVTVFWLNDIVVKKSSHTTLESYTLSITCQF
jgi:PAX-interacting protein 1